jgi:phosphatidate phosphatase APP1
MGSLLVVTNAGAQAARFQAALPPEEKRAFRGEVFLLEEAGLSVISDIDDTIKVTQVWDRNKMMRNTFARNFDPVPGMAKFYQRLARERGAQFHYISASPWQLYEPLAAFIYDNNFPAGTFSLKTFRWKNKTALSLFADPEKYKPTVIEPLLKQFPKRSFILIGDSGERDPEVYAALARKYPKQIEGIYIRNVTGEPASAARYQNVFVGLPENLWKIFTRPEELTAVDARSH